MGHHLVDRYLLQVHPVVLGEGQRLFPPGVPAAAMKLSDSSTPRTGVAILTYLVEGRDH